MDCDIELDVDIEMDTDRNMDMDTDTDMDVDKDMDADLNMDIDKWRRIFEANRSKLKRIFLFIDSLCFEANTLK
jgi:hypothetical protein